MLTPARNTGRNASDSPVVGWSPARDPLLQPVTQTSWLSAVSASARSVTETTADASSLAMHTNETTRPCGRVSCMTAEMCCDAATWPQPAAGSGAAVSLVRNGVPTARKLRMADTPEVTSANIRTRMASARCAVSSTPATAASGPSVGQPVPTRVDHSAQPETLSNAATKTRTVLLSSVKVSWQASPARRLPAMTPAISSVSPTTMAACGRIGRDAAGAASSRTVTAQSHVGSCQALSMVRCAMKTVLAEPARANVRPNCAVPLNVPAT